MYVIHNADAATWLQAYTVNFTFSMPSTKARVTASSTSHLPLLEGGLVWTAALEEAVQFATEAEAKAVCCANGICECWVEAV